MNQDPVQTLIKAAATAGIIGVVVGAAGFFAQILFLITGGTGDPALIGACTGLMVASISGLAGVAGLAIRARKREDDDEK